MINKPALEIFVFGSAQKERKPNGSTTKRFHLGQGVVIKNKDRISEYGRFNTKKLKEDDAGTTAQMFAITFALKLIPKKQREETIIVYVGNSFLVQAYNSWMHDEERLFKEKGAFKQRYFFRWLLKCKTKIFKDLRMALCSKTDTSPLIKAAQDLARQLEDVSLPLSPLSPIIKIKKKELKLKKREAFKARPMPLQQAEVNERRAKLKKEMKSVNVQKILELQKRIAYEATKTVNNLDEHNSNP